MNKVAIIFTATPPLLVAILLAIVIHINVILGVNFTAPEPLKINPSMAITIVAMPNKIKPKKATFLVQKNQINAGEKAKAVLLKQKSSNPNKNQKQSSLERHLGNKSPTKISPTTLRKQIAQIGIKIRNKQLSYENSRIKSINSVPATHKSKVAHYLTQWQNKVERIGNRNYPAMTRKQNSSLQMDVAINHDGSIYHIKIRKSSGIKSLDEAAARIVRMGAPYAPLPQELQNSLDVLVINRVWNFLDKTNIHKL